MRTATKSFDSAAEIAILLGKGDAWDTRAAFLRASGHRVQTFDERASALGALQLSCPDLTILDVTGTSASEDGLWLCSEIRGKWPQLPLLVLGSDMTEETRIAGLRAGADDCVSADVSLRLLTTRLETLLERYAAVRAKQERLSETFSIGALRIDSRRSEVSWNQRPVPLSLGSYRMVTALATGAPQPKTPEELMEAAETRVQRNTVAARIRSIRLQFREVDREFDNIRTERGHGYRWVP